MFFHFDISITITEEDNSVRFSFKSDVEQRIDFGLAERIDVFSDLKGNALPFSIDTMNERLNDELAECFKGFVRNFDFTTALRPS